MANVELETIGDDNPFRPKFGWKDGRLMRGVAGGLGLLLVLLLAGWYWPLHRAHTELRNEFASASETAKGLRSELAKTSAALGEAIQARDALNQREADRATLAKERGQAMATLYDSVQSGVRSRVEKKQASLDKDGQSFSLTLQHRSLQKADSVDLTGTAATFLCKALEPIKAAKSVRVRIQGLGTDAQAKSASLKPYKSGLEVGAARAARAATKLWDCGFRPANLVVEAAVAPKKADSQTLRVVVEPAPAE